MTHSIFAPRNPKLSLGGYRDFLGNAAVFSASEQCRMQGDFFRIGFPFFAVWMVNDAAVAHEILIKKEGQFEKSRIYWKELRKIIGPAMGNSEGDEWLNIRKLQNEYFTRKEVERHLTLFYNRYMEAARRLHPGTVEPLAFFTQVNANLLMESLFGYQATEEEIATIVKAISSGEDLISWRSKFPWRPTLSVFNPGHHEAKKSLLFLSRFTKGLVEKQKQGSDKLVNTLISNGLDHQSIRNELIVHIGAGTETLSVTLTWAVYLLARHADILKKVLEEIDAMQPETSFGDFTMPALPYLESVLKEAMRLYPPSHAIVRDALEDTTLCGKEVKQGESIYISAYGLHRNPKYWPNPDQFDPERFTPENEEKQLTYSYIPYGAGKHSCIGKYFANPMMKLALATLLKQFTVSLAVNQPIFPVSLSTLKPNQPIVIRLTKRTNA